MLTIGAHLSASKGYTALTLFSFLHVIRGVEVQRLLMKMT